MNLRPWYKRYPADFIAGTLALTLEQKGAYSIVLDLMYDQGGPIPDDPKWIARVCGCSVRKWKAIRQILINHGKIEAENDVLINFRVEKEAENSAKEARKLAENGAKGGLKRAENLTKVNGNSHLAKKGLPKTAKHTRSQSPETRKEKEYKEKEFDEFWAAYPRKVGKGQARKAYATALKTTDAAILLTAVQRIPKPEDMEFFPHPSTWLNGERWLDETGPSENGEDTYDDFKAAAKEHTADLLRQMKETME